MSRCPSLYFLFECQGRHLYSLCPGVPVIIFVPVVICVPVLCWWWLLIEHSLSPVRFLFECSFRNFYSLCPGVPVVICVPMSRSVISSVVKTWCKSTHNHDVNRQTHIQLFYIYLLAVGICCLPANFSTFIYLLANLTSKFSTSKFYGSTNKFSIRIQIYTSLF